MFSSVDFNAAGGAYHRHKFAFFNGYIHTVQCFGGVFAFSVIFFKVFRSQYIHYRHLVSFTVVRA
jgi:hypothetical protein